MNTDFLPNLFILGAAKSGTTTLHTYLAETPDVCMSHPKEPFFFECEYHLGIDYYRRTYFAHWKGERVIGEARHRNLFLPYVPERVRAFNPEAKLLVVLRNPVERAYSHWWHWYFHGREKLDFRAALEADLERIQKGLRCDTPEEIEGHCRNLGYDGYDSHGFGTYRTYVDSGYYLEQIQRYLKLFPREQMKIILFEDLVKEPRRAMSEVSDFLGVENLTAREGFRPKVENVKETRLFRKVSKIYEAARMRSFLPEWLRKWGRRAIDRLNPDPGIDPETRAWLKGHYRPYNEALASFLDRDLSSWDR